MDHFTFYILTYVYLISNFRLNGEEKKVFQKKTNTTSVDEYSKSAQVSETGQKPSCVDE